MNLVLIESWLDVCLLQVQFKFHLLRSKFYDFSFSSTNKIMMNFEIRVSKKLQTNFQNFICISTKNSLLALFSLLKVGWIYKVY